MMNSTKDHFIRYRSQVCTEKRNDDKTTLIIGAVCKEGVILIADTKVVDTGKNTWTSESKILLPIPDKAAVAVGAAGLTDVFYRFNRRIPIVFDRRQKEFRIDNEAQLRKIELSMSDFEPVEAPDMQGGESSVREAPKIKALPSGITPPYSYTGDDFLTDCKEVIKDVTEDERRTYPNPLDVLLAFKAGEPQLYRINSYGFESQVRQYAAIGSGSVYVDMFFSKLWKQKTYAETIALASFVIKFIQNMGLDNFVGVADGEMPQVVVLPKADPWGEIQFSNKMEFLQDAEVTSHQISESIMKIKLPKLQLAEGSVLSNY